MTFENKEEYGKEFNKKKGGKSLFEELFPVIIITFLIIIAYLVYQLGQNIIDMQNQLDVIFKAIGG